MEIGKRQPIPCVLPGKAHPTAALSKGQDSPQITGITQWPVHPCAPHQSPYLRLSATPLLRASGLRASGLPFWRLPLTAYRKVAMGKSRELLEAGIRVPEFCILYFGGGGQEAVRRVLVFPIPQYGQPSDGHRDG